MAVCKSEAFSANSVIPSRLFYIHPFVVGWDVSLVIFPRGKAWRKSWGQRECIYNRIHSEFFRVSHFCLKRFLKRIIFWQKTYYHKSPSTIQFPILGHWINAESAKMRLEFQFCPIDRRQAFKSIPHKLNPFLVRRQSLTREKSCKFKVQLSCLIK